MGPVGWPATLWRTSGARPVPSPGPSGPRCGCSGSGRGRDWHLLSKPPSNPQLTGRREPRPVAAPWEGPAAGLSSGLDARFTRALEEVPPRSAQRPDQSSRHCAVFQAGGALHHPGSRGRNTGQQAGVIGVVQTVSGASPTAMVHYRSIPGETLRWQSSVFNNGHRRSAPRNRCGPRLWRNHGPLRWRLAGRC